MSNAQLTDGSPVPADRSHTELRPDGQQKGYVVLTPEERAKGFVKPVRRKYIHVGAPPLPDGVRDLTAEEDARWNYGPSPPYVKYFEYPPGSRLAGKFFTRAQAERAGKHCGCVTTMGLAIAETYARNPSFYSGTFCVGCGEHFDLCEFVWEPDGEPMDPALQEAWHASKAARDILKAANRQQIRIESLRAQRENINKILAELGAE
jgi:hypothetical protein